MRNLFASALMILCLTLTACGGSEQQRFEEGCTRLAEAAAIRATAQVQADFGETLEEYTLEYSYDGDTWSVLVTAPEYASGLTARITEGGSELEYDGVILATGDLMSDGIAPIAALPLLAEMLDRGFVDRVWTEEETLVGHVQYSDTMGANLWLDSHGLPVAAELIEKGIVKAGCTFTNVTIEEDNHEDKTDLGGNQSGESGT